MKTIGLLIVFVSGIFLCISCEHMGTNAERKDDDCNPAAHIDTTRTYFYYVFDEKVFLPLLPIFVSVGFDSLATDQQIDDLLAEYGLKEEVRLTIRDRTKLLVRVPAGKRAEEFFTFYGDSMACGFGNQNLVAYATPVFLSRPDSSALLLLTNEFIMEIDTVAISFEQFEEIIKQDHLIFRKQPYTTNTYLLKVSSVRLKTE